MARIEGHGIVCDLPSGFEGEIYALTLGPGETPARGVQALAPTAARATGDEPAPEPEAPAGSVAPMAATAGPTTPPVLHVATFPLPPERGDYGNGAVDHMGTEDIFIALCEFDEEASRSVLYAAEGLPTLTAADFDTSTLHRSFPNHSGCQRFFHVGTRAFCLYVVLGSHNFRDPLVRRVNELVAEIDIAAG